MIQQYRLGLVWTHHATQADRPSIGCRRHDIGALDASQLLQHCRRAISQPRPARPPLQCLAQDIGEEADQQMCLHSPGRLVPDRPNAEIVLMDAEGGLRIREMHIGTPQFFLVPIRDVASQQIAALTGPRPGLSRPQSPKPVEVLTEALKDNDPSVRGAAIAALAQIGPGAKAAIPELTRVLMDSDSGIGGLAASALGAIGKEAVPELLEAYKTGDPELRLRVLAALAPMGAEASAAVPVLEQA